MGVTGSNRGVTLTFKDATGKKDARESITGKTSLFFAKQRSESPESLDPMFGSPDWLTDIIVVDDPAKLATLRPSQSETAFTSASSKHVFVQWDVGNDRGRMRGCFTIATGTPVSADGHLEADNVIVLPPETQMKPGHSLFGLWAAQRPVAPPSPVNPSPARVNQNNESEFRHSTVE